MKTDELKRMAHKLIDEMDDITLEQSADAFRWGEGGEMTLMVSGYFVTIRGYLKKDLPPSFEALRRRATRLEQVRG